MTDLPAHLRPRWSFVLTDTRGEQIGGLTEARGRSLSFDLRGPASVKWTMDARHPQAAAIEELRTDLVVYRDRRKMFRGRVGSIDENIDADRHTMSCSAVDYRGVLGARVDRWGRTYNAVNQYEIGFDLALNVACWGTGGDLGLKRGTSPTLPKSRFETIEVDTPIDKALDRFQDQEFGFEWWIDPELYVHLATWRGVMRQWDFPMAWGTTGLEVKRSFDTSKYGNWVRVRGGKMPAPPDGKMVPDWQQLIGVWGEYLYDAWWVGTSQANRWLHLWTGSLWWPAEDMPTPFADRWAPDLDRRPEGRIDRVVTNSDLLSQEAVDAAADALLEDSLHVPAEYTATLQPGMWIGPDQLWLGDRIPIVIRSGRLDLVTTGRVWNIDITIDDDGAETLDLTFGEVTAETLEAGRSGILGRESLADRVERLERRRFQNIVMGEGRIREEAQEEVGLQSGTAVGLTTDAYGRAGITFPVAFVRSPAVACTLRNETLQGWNPSQGAWGWFPIVINEVQVSPVGIVVRLSWMQASWSDANWQFSPFVANLAGVWIDWIARGDFS